LDLTPLLKMPEVGPEVSRYCVQKQDHGIADILDRKLIEQCRPAIDRGEKVTLELPIRNLNRTVGTMLSSQIAKKYGLEGLPADTITIKFNGSAGQSFGAFLSRGITLVLEGESNDYIGKGPLGRQDHRLPAEERDLHAGRNHPGRQYLPVRWNAGRSLFLRHGRGNGSRCGTVACGLSSKGPATMAANT
jgi:hypothetical protein